MATIVVLNGRTAGEWHSFGEKRPLVIGRDRDLLAEIIDPWVSHRHMEIRWDTKDGCFYAVDLDSRNGVQVNGQPINKFKALSEGDVIRIGNSLIVFTDQDFDHYRAGEAFYKEALKTHHEQLTRIEEKEKAFQEKDLSALDWLKNLSFKPRGY